MKKLFFFCFILLSSILLYAQDYPQWPADKPETGFIENSQSREIRIGNLILPQEVDMQDKMRTLITVMMKNASKKLGWPMVELSEYTNNNGLQGGGTPYNLRSPRGILITFQFIASNDTLQEWKKYQLKYNKGSLNKQTQDYHNITAATKSQLYKRYQDSANHYMNLYTGYVNAHQNEGAGLFIKDKHPKYYQQKENEFINKMTAMTDGQHEDDGVEKFEAEGAKITGRFRNHTVVEVTFHVNNFTAGTVPLGSGPLKFTSAPYPKNNTKVSRIFSIPLNQEPEPDWQAILAMLLGNFKTKLNEYGNYDAGFNHNSQGDEHTPKKIKSDKIQNISIIIKGNEKYIRQMAALIDVDKLNGTIVQQ